MLSLYIIFKNLLFQTIPIYIILKITCIKKKEKTICKLGDMRLLHQKFLIFRDLQFAVYPLYQTVFIENANQ